MQINLNSILFTSCDDIHQICKPLFEHTLIRYFEYVRLFNDGSVVKLDSRAGVIPYILQNDLYMKPAEVGGPMGRYLMMSLHMPISDTNKITNSLHTYRNYFGIEDFLFINVPSENYFECFIFGSELGKTEVIQFYMNHLDVLENFIFYFKEQARDLIEKALKEKVVFQEWKEALQGAAAKDELAELKAKTTPKAYPIKAGLREVWISRREFECLKAYLNGESSKQLARILNISSRTIETHLSNIKHKLNCYTKTDLLELIMKSGYERLI